MFSDYVYLVLVKPFTKTHRPNFGKRISETGEQNICSFSIQNFPNTYDSKLIKTYSMVKIRQVFT